MPPPRSLLTLAALVVASGAALAQEAPMQAPTGSALTRAEVRAQARAAVAAHEVQIGEAVGVLAPPASVETRAEVKDELRRALADRADPRPVGEPLGFERRDSRRG